MMKSMTILSSLLTAFLMTPIYPRLRRYARECCLCLRAGRVLLPVCTVAAGCLEGGQFGAGFGVASGLLLATLGHGGWGFVALLAFVGWLSGLLGQYVLRQDLWGHVICCLVLLVLWEAVQLLAVATSTSAPLGVLLSLAAGEGLCSLVCAFPIYGMNRFCCVHYGRIYHE